MILKNISIVTEEIEVRNNVNVKINNDVIESIDEYNPEHDNKLEDSDEEVIIGDNLIMMPGFYNAHGHSPMSLMRGYGENMSLQDWLFKKIFPFEDHLTSEAVYYGTLLSIAESFKYGIVSTSDMYYFVEDMVRAYSESGAKGNISRAIANPEGVPFDELPSIDEMKAMCKKYHRSSDGRIIIDSSLHAEYTSDENTAIKLAELTKALGIRMHVHVSETKTEHEECKERHEGRTPIEYLRDSGLLDIPAIAAHCVWVEEKDLDIIKEKNVTIASNPVSNLKLASGIADVVGMREKGITVAIGTDSVASNNNLNMFEEMKTLMLLAKVKNMDPTLISPKEALMMATRNGALAQGRENCGFIKEGFKADFLLIRTDSANMQPAHDIINNLVLSATDSDIYMTVIDGKPVYREGVYTTIDLPKVIEGANKSVERILKEL